VEVRWLRPEDDRSGFSCGDAEFDAFLQKYAGQDQFKHRIGRTLVAVDDGRLIAYATVVPGHVDADELDDKARAGLPAYPIPVLRLARLAVDVRAQRKGLGTLLTAEAIDVAMRLREDLGCVALVADVLVERRGFYERLGFVPLKVVRGRAPVPGTVAMSLPLRRVEEVRTELDSP
jgi:GNAT superfamily N-acetyltransferase